MFRTTTLALALAATLAGLVPAAPAQAGGSITFTLLPQGRDAQIIRDGLMIYSLFQDAKNRAKVDQKGRNNAAAIAQSGRGHYAQVFQRGQDHRATIDQSGYGNALAVFQFGKGANAHAVQNGAGQVGLVFQHGW